MKRILLLIVFMAAVALHAQKQVNLGLIPTPQRVAEVDSSRMVVLAKAKVKYVQLGDASAFGSAVENADQAYIICFERKRIIVSYLTEEGKAYAEMTLNQLRTLYEQVPSMLITDWPAYKLRGWMDDISRGPVTRMAYRTRQWRTLHELKYNFCNYYTEHTLYQSEFPDLAPVEADCMRFPDEVINLQLFAHAEKTLRIPFYEHLMDSRANFNPDNEATYDFLRKRVGEAWRQNPLSPFFIIDCDETEQLGTGRAKALVRKKGDEQVYVDYINRCNNIVQQEAPMIKRTAGSEVTKPRVVMWGDIVAKNPEMMRQLPKDMTYIMWAYEPLESYDHLIRPFQENGTPFWVAPSLSHSSVMLPSPQRYMTNIANLARDGHRAGAEGLMNTCWDDNGEALFDNCWHGLYWSAEMAWNPLKTDDPAERERRERQFNENFERLFYGERRYNPDIPTYDGLPFNVSSLYQVGALESNPEVADWYTSAALMEPLLGFNPSNTLIDTTQPTRESRVSAFLRSGIRKDSQANPHVNYFIDRLTCTMHKSLLRRMIYYYLHELQPMPDEAFLREAMDDYLKELHHLKCEYLRLWDQENCAYEREIVCHRYDALAREVLDLDRHVFATVEAGEGAPQVSLRTLFSDRPIYYTLDGSLPDSSSVRYSAPFALPQSATIKAITYNEYGEGVVSEQYLLSHLGMGASLTLGTPYSTYKAIYSGGGTEALVDGQLGSNATYADGHWQGYWGDSVDAVIDFAQPRAVGRISMRFMQNTFDWILAPTEIRVLTSSDGQQWNPIAEQHYPMDPRETGMRLKRYVVDLPSDTKARFLRVIVPNSTPLPAWHPAPGQPAYLFTDEIVVE